MLTKHFVNELEDTITVMIYHHGNGGKNLASHKAFKIKSVTFLISSNH